MNKYDKYKARMEWKRAEQIDKLKNRALSKQSGYALIDHSYNVKEGIIKFSKGVTLEHLLAMTKVCYYLKRHNIKFYTELIFKKEYGIGRADIFIPDKMICVEILGSESISKFKDIKLENYPLGLDIIPLQAIDVLQNDFSLNNILYIQNK